MRPEGSGPVVIFPVNVIGDCPADRYPLGTGDHGNEPASGDDQCQNFCQGGPRLAAQNSASVIEADEPA